MSARQHTPRKENLKSPNHREVDANGVRVEAYGVEWNARPAPPNEALRRSILEVGKEIGLVTDRMDEWVTDYFDGSRL